MYAHIVVDFFKGDALNNVYITAKLHTIYMHSFGKSAFLCILLESGAIEVNSIASDAHGLAT